MHHPPGTDPQESCWELLAIREHGTPRRGTRESRGMLPVTRGGRGVTHVTQGEGGEVTPVTQVGVGEG